MSKNLKRSYESMVQQTPSLEQGIKITVQKNKACVTVVNWGHGPFAYEKIKDGDLACIPSEFKVETKSDGEYWIGETLVDKDEEPFYRFSLKRDLSIKSHWHTLPTTAYIEALGLLDPSKKNMKGANGKLILGVHYSTVQVYLRNYFQQEQGIALKTLNDKDVKIHKRKRTRVSSLGFNINGIFEEEYHNLPLFNIDDIREEEYHNFNNNETQMSLPVFNIDDIREEEYHNLNVNEELETNLTHFEDLRFPFDFIDNFQTNEMQREDMNHVENLDENELNDVIGLLSYESFDLHLDFYDRLDVE